MPPPPHPPRSPSFSFWQTEVFEEVSQFVQSALDGYNVSLLAYGQTGAGKTHTMIGAQVWSKLWSKLCQSMVERASEGSTL